ncbi:propionyl-CoA carboxylase alpha chain/3-methylcrotonyl-CoA carboxylase alpha subunit/acetyl-CoA/propionyl-CoA carboxylase, biotin carboxylase, biotin carboxyl carrier protein [Tistlia consotensis]|uniref:Propionyl-CoA carboxylase alpha chain/3-methylcrotonyl-CoA carboxylase alpha subunit/acetyl-CoA/propionyl-CoA carboxylase, biotin carboxylase, biotin carboxyl carrier protein n=1 Tax=Tistlia consotensis USBA 355 TaxID=560819 RepID=A0A1Y6BDX9_9PROT|nr:biotin carboxylase N-terminal domain-containing protein [Tistlia consotensis]SMF04460.1 propionyl-CoA carboxylase alpha chain/3-methylcrotonyl-CoA carboxylase alpha subunit/acetyl-CoA/propionyl-CoA carboxylase, biotin carboxylase, biotin carboxyl carrier protein [Tistlia consotensis USBA 355]SNR54488.1 propionyl-CoA carboxylase alpha chain/3-methylcrotonyl-CoA carboxylase alpha subunit/acetyl-CoA/propionyl-CoA carboxylase, biotin carboxylase, biotin carboxyl carrier protein [Tistlia consotensi
MSVPPPFRKVLIANRGEIACRIIRTLHKLGIAAVAVHHASERRARHVREADEAWELAGPTPVAAHLDGGQIVEIARRAGAEAVHPGYGFLSENAGFARQVAEAGLVFVGPDAETIHLMGDKIRARDFAAAHGVPVAPSVTPTGDLAAFVAEAEAIGFPLLIKAAAGGGGKGMSIVRHRGELAERARVAASEAERYFSDGRVYAELYVERPRHIEVQVLGDGQGGVLHLYERECSVQRRFQKIVEEAPAASLPAALREEICAAAVRLASAARYRNAGTVEFILAPDGRFFFLEMNTRLQVEHPVTEMVTGLDLVKAQLEIAAGGGLPLAQEQVALTGHAIECRLCAEDPERDFLPETGRILALDEPAGPALRFESGLLEGQAVTSDFDPMLAKLVVHGGDRAAAIEAGLAALDRLVLLGVGTNQDYLSRLLGHPAFRAGRLHTGFVAEHAGDLAAVPPEAALRDAALVAAALGFREFRALAFETPEPYASMGGWRN